MRQAAGGAARQPLGHRRAGGLLVQRQLAPLVATRQPGAVLRVGVGHVRLAPAGHRALPPQPAVEQIAEVHVVHHRQAGRGLHQREDARVVQEVVAHIDHHAVIGVGQVGQVQLRPVAVWQVEGQARDLLAPFVVGGDQLHLPAARRQAFGHADPVAADGGARAQRPGPGHAPCALAAHRGSLPSAAPPGRTKTRLAESTSASASASVGAVRPSGSPISRGSRP